MTLYKIKELDLQFQRFTGREAFGHVSSPTPTSRHYTFATGEVLTSDAEALGCMLILLDIAKTEPDKLPYPLDQELTPEQDLRVINGWPCPVCGFDLKSDGWPPEHRSDPDGRVCPFKGPGAA